MLKIRTIEQQNALNERLIFAANKGDVPAIEEAIKEGAEIDARDENKCTPLHYAAFNGHTDIVLALLEAGAEVGALDEDKTTALHWVASSNHIPIIETLLAAGADITLKDKNNNRPIDIALDRDRTAIADYLQSIEDGKTKRPTPQSVGLDMHKRNAALTILGKPSAKPVIGEHTAKVLTGMEAQRQAALNDPSEGI